MDFLATRSELGSASAYPAEATAEARDAFDAFAGGRIDRTGIAFTPTARPRYSWRIRRRRSVRVRLVAADPVARRIGLPACSR
ncbi:hypothetical protein [Nocardia arizonensis]|uniref:hypothetical protein n=1 Tax=Nocardia arizonensis TaxID=1141647 RepID=UPI0006D1E0C5|nr:hypothetical protein [Nocardia arizonensis]